MIPQFLVVVNNIVEREKPRFARLGSVTSLFVDEEVQIQLVPPTHGLASFED